MPYVNEKSRLLFDAKVKIVEDMTGYASAGDINYIFTRILKSWLGDTPNYDRYNAAIGILESCKMELYRRRVAPYEDKKILENGDV